MTHRQKIRGMALLLRVACLSLMALLTLPACTSNPNPADTISAQGSPTGTAPLPGPDHTPSATPTLTETVAPSATPLATVSPTLSISPTAAPTRLPCWQEGGKIIQHTLETPLTPNPWPFRVYTPPCYDQQTQNYPLLILIHGSSFLDDQWDRIGADETADTLMSNGEIPPFLILMPYDWYWTHEPFNDPFGEALVEYLLPWMEANYRTLPGRENRAIGGLSRGASWAIHLGLKHWDLFSAVGGHSLPVFPTDPVFLEEWLKTIPPTSVPRFFLDMGEEDTLLEKALWFENLLNTYNVPHEWYLYPGTHEESYWSRHVAQYLRWYAQPWSHLE